MKKEKNYNSSTTSIALILDASFPIDSRRTIFFDRWLRKKTFFFTQSPKNIGSSAHTIGKRFLIRIPETKIKTKTSVVYKQRAKSEVSSYENFLLWPMLCIACDSSVSFYFLFFLFLDNFVDSAEYFTNACKETVRSEKKNLMLNRSIGRMIEIREESKNWINTGACFFGIFTSKRKKKNSTTAATTTTIALVITVIQSTPYIKCRTNTNDMNYIDHVFQNKSNESTNCDFHHYTTVKMCVLHFANKRN